MNKLLFSIIVASAIIACILVSGCFISPAASRPTAAASSAGAVPATGSLGAILQDIGIATAADAISERMDPFFTVGVGMVALGALTIIFGGRAAGASLMLLGIATAGTGVLFIQYPWVVLLLTLVAAGVAAIIAFDRWRVSKRLGTTTEELGSFEQATEILAGVIEKVQGGREVKDGIRDLGPEAVAAVKKVVTPIKENMVNSQAAG